MKKPKLINIQDARATLTELVDKAFLLQEETIILKSGKPRAKIVGLSEKEIEQLKKELIKND